MPSPNAPPAPIARWRSGRSRAVRWAASTAGTTSAARASNAGTVSPVRCRKTDGCFRRDASRAIMAGPVGERELTRQTMESALP